MTTHLSRRAILGSFGIGASMLAVPAWARGENMNHGHSSGHSRGGPRIPSGFNFASRSLNTFRLVAGGAASMALCTPAVAASQFTLFMAFVNFGNMAAGASLGWIDSLGGIPAMFSALGVCGLLSAAFAFASKVAR